MKKVITYGTFDMFHYGHYNLLKRAKQLYPETLLFVGVSSDEMCKEKGKIPFLNENVRKEIISDIKFVDKVFFEYDMSQKVEDVKKYGIDVFVLGSDYKKIFSKMPEYGQLVEIGCEVVFLERTPAISSTELRQKVIEQNNLNKNGENLYILTNNQN